MIELGVLRERGFRRYFTGWTLSRFGDALVPLALAFAVLDLTGSATALGLALLASRLPMVAFVLLGGVLGDRLPRHLVLLGADLVRCATQAVTAALLVTGQARLWQLVALQAVHGTAAAFSEPAGAGMAPALVPADRLRQANGLLTLGRQLATISAQPVAAALVATVGGGWALAVDAGTFLASAASLALLDGSLLRPRATLPARDGTPGPRPGLARQLAEGWAHVRTRGWLGASILHVALLNTLVIAPSQVLGPVVARDHLGGAPAWAAVGTCTTLGALAGGALSLRLDPPRPILAATLATFGIIPLIALLALPAPAWLVALAGLPAGAQASVQGTLFTTAVQTHVPAEALARVTSYVTLGSLVAVPLGQAAAGPLADRFGVSPTLWGCAAWAALSTGLVLTVPGVRQLAQARNDHGLRTAVRSP